MVSAVSTPLAFSIRLELIRQPTWFLALLMAQRVFGLKALGI